MIHRVYIYSTLGYYESLETLEGVGKYRYYYCWVRGFGLFSTSNTHQLAIL